MRYLLTVFLFIFCGRLLAMEPTPGSNIIEGKKENTQNSIVHKGFPFCTNLFGQKTQSIETTYNSNFGGGETPQIGFEKVHNFNGKNCYRILVVWESTKCPYEDFFNDLPFAFGEDVSVSGKQSRHFFAKIDNYNCEFIFLPVSSFNLCSFYQNKVDVVFDCFDYLSSWDKMGFYDDCQKKFDLADLFIKGKSTKTPLFLFGLWHPENPSACCAFKSVRHCLGEKLSKEELSFVDYGVDKDWLKTKLIDLLSKISCH